MGSTSLRRRAATTSGDGLRDGPDCAAPTLPTKPGFSRRDVVPDGPLDETTETGATEAACGAPFSERRRRALGGARRDRDGARDINATTR